jgi:uncharacterized protein
MIRVVFDCNIFLQSLLNPNSVAAKCFQLVRQKKVSLFVSKDTMDEVRDVLLRPNILARLPDATEEQIETFIAEVLQISILVKQIAQNFYYQRDPKDEIIVNLALACEADFIVSRDKDLLDLMTDVSVEAKEFRQKSRPLKIVEPLEFLEIISNRELPLNP